MCLICVEENTRVLREMHLPNPCVLLTWRGRYIMADLDLETSFGVKFLNKVLRRVETLFVQGNQDRTDQNKPLFLLPK